MIFDERKILDGRNDFKRLVVITIDTPYPPRGGHKLEQYNRFLAYRNNGFDLCLVNWAPPDEVIPDRDEADVVLRSIFSDRITIPIHHDAISFMKRVALLPFLPSHASSRVPRSKEMQAIIERVATFKPSAILLDNIYGYYVANKLRRHFDVPIILRSHNVEHRYFQQQAALASNSRDKIAWSLARVGLKSFEKEVMANSHWIFDISVDDIAYWRQMGIVNNSWLPPLFPENSGLAKPISWGERRWDVGYIGSLRLPNNVAGVLWFLKNVYPILKRSDAGIRICIAGSNPSQLIREAMNSGAYDIDFIPDAPSAAEILSNCRVLMNPIFSGSGVNVKSVEMLRYPSEVVTTSIGSRGLDDDIGEQFLIANEPLKFAELINESLSHEYIQTVSRLDAIERFGSIGVQRMIKETLSAMAGDL